MALQIADGDSFALGDRKLRLDGIDAPEYHQLCTDERGQPWECGKAARASLEKMLRMPGLACSAAARDQYARSIATCSVDGVPDLGAAQVSAGMAVSHEYYGIRDYGDEEDSAIAAKRGIWRGRFDRPESWRATHARGN